MVLSLQRALVRQWRVESHRHWIRNYSSSIEKKNLHKRAVAALGKKPPSASNGTQKSETKESTLKSVSEVAAQLDKNKISEDSKESKLDSELGTKVEEPVATNVRPSLTTTTALHEFAPRIVVVGVGGAGSNALDNMISRQLSGVEFLAVNTDAQHLSNCLTDNRLQLGDSLTSGLGCGANPDAGRLAAEESREALLEKLQHAHMVFITAGMGGGTGTGAAPVVANLCYDLGILTVGVVTIPFHFEGTHRMRLAKEGLERIKEYVDTLIVIPNQNLFQIADDTTSFLRSFQMADDVLLAGVKSITDLMTTPGLINLDFADVQSVMQEMGHAMLGTGQSSEKQTRAEDAAMQALHNPLLTTGMDISTAKGLLVNITGGPDMTLFEVDKAAQTITNQIKDPNANIIFGSAYDESLEGSIRVSVVATGISSTNDNDNTI